MKDAGPATQLRSDFDAFLQSPIGDDSNGMLLSVLSALARTNLDPWKEAAELARLPRDSAVRRLAAFIETLSGVSLGGTDCKMVATRLVVLLPRPQILDIPKPENWSRAQGILKPRTSITYIVLFIVILALGAQYAFEILNRTASPDGATPHSPRTISSVSSPRSHGP